jgi:hypothetical protein|tara:strand:+ start:10078 stop:10236 length:159 start_codon:yes stop_codon:yes gene_type:complete
MKNMSAYDYLRDLKDLKPADSLNELSFTTDIETIAEYMEGYHQAKLRVTTIK